MIAHAAVRACLLFYVVRPEGPSTFAVKHADVLCAVYYVIFSKRTTFKVRKSYFI